MPDGARPALQTGALVALFFAVVLWGVVPVFTRTLSVALGPGDHLAIRYSIVSVIYAGGLMITRNWRIAFADMPRLVGISLFGMVSYNLGAATGFLHVSAGAGSLIVGTEPLLIALFGALESRERLSVSTWGGLALGFAGIVMLVWRDIDPATNGAEFLTGCLQVFGAGVGMAIYVVGARPLVMKYGPYPITAWTILIAGGFLLALFARPSTFNQALAMSPRSWLEMGYMVVFSTFIAAILWNHGAARVPAAAAGAFIYLVPIIGVAAGALMLDEPLTPGMLAGGGLILAGVAIAQFAPLLRLNGKSKALAAILFAVTMWGLIPVAMRYLILGLSPATAMVLRLYPAGVIALGVLTIIGMRPVAWRDWVRIAIATFAGNVAYQILAAYGMQSVPASWTGLIFGLEPVFIALFAVLLAGERLTPWLAVGMALALSGTIALMLGSALVPTADVSAIGLALVTASTMGWGIYTVVIRPVSRKYGSLQVACLALGLSALPMVVFVPADLPQVVSALNPTQWLTVGFVVIFGTFLATAAWNYALGHMESSLAGVFLYVQPIVAALGGVFLLGEHLTWPLLAGGALILLGVAVAQFGRRLFTKPASVTP